MLIYASRTAHKAKINAHLQCKAISNSCSLCDQFSEYCETLSLTEQVTPFFFTRNSVSGCMYEQHTYT